MFDNIRALKEVSEILRDIRRRDFKGAEEDALQLLVYLGYPEASEHLAKALVEVRNGDYRDAFRELTFELNALVDYFGQPQIVTGPRRRLQEELIIAEQDPKGWFALNREEYIQGSQRPLIRFLRRRHPELDEEVFASFCSGNLVQDTLSGKFDKERIIAFIDKILPILAVLSNILPYVIPVYITLKIISLIYHNNHPKMVGLSLEDFL